MKSFIKDLTDPQNPGSKVISQTESTIQFKNNTYPITKSGIPVLVLPGGLFDIDSIINQTPTTQDTAYSNKKKLKNKIRRVILPALARDKNFHKRYAALNTTYHPKKVLVIGAGEKIDYYKTTFPDAEVITSDVHVIYNCDIVFDAHQIPFPDNYFDLIIAGQVMEHTIRPWIVAQELQRVAKPNGIMHIEVPFAFPYHGPPFDFYRFTFSGLRSIFEKSNVQEVFVTEGLFSAAAVTLSNTFIESCKIPFFRSMGLATARILFFWMKYLDFTVPKKLSNCVSQPAGFGVTFQKDNINRNDVMILSELNGFLNNGVVK